MAVSVSLNSSSFLSSPPFCSAHSVASSRSSGSRHSLKLQCSSRQASPTLGLRFWARLYIVPLYSSHRTQGCRAFALARSSASTTAHDSEEANDDSEQSSFFPYVSKTVVAAISDLTPLKAVKWTTFAALVSISIRWICNTFVFNPKAWMFGSWLLVLWPWPAALIVGLLALSACWKHYKGKATKEEQFLILAGSLVWLILVPLAHVHGFVDGWPLTLFFTYTFFFLINPIVRARLYEELSPPPEFKEWDIRPPLSEQIAFTVAVVVGHLLAALEAPPLVYSWNGQWQSKLAAAILLLAIVLHWNATYFLGKYSYKLAKPRAVVMFGPYRFMRHPIYSSFMLLFAGYCLSLRSYWSLSLLIAASLIYYERRAGKEEGLLEEKFGQLYTSYKERVASKYLPWVY
ncbi:hypothetical protein O6H91_14G016800 [Diphasiastrum complanatum]|uniref:Uncharacterized protein n=1 Tax=Diphasiastrum complanatum TaxID=34168 RepID=A0ACC2BLZ5_DIPCM|nr:hypothetical protein O6H91_14G016800 [Diphasiastrum complanatum]